MENILIIIPVKQTLVKKDCFMRLYLNCLKLYRLGIKNVLVIDATSNFILKKINECITKKFNFIYKNSPQLEVYTPGRLKNKAAEYAFKQLNFEFILYLDVDVFLKKEILSVLEKNARNKIIFDWLPVLFLNKNISLWKASSDRNIYLSSQDIIQIGYSSGIQFIHHSLFYKIGGYNENYEGYGCEDIEMIHKASYFLGLRKKVMSDYYKDIRSHNLEDLGGYRAFFYECQKNYDLNKMPLHIWHKRKNNSNYLKKRQHNDALLKNEMISFDKKYLVY